ncbi:MAG: hypothetical protein AAB267_03985 [Candidatus Desantisbacteria bacterium]
MSGRYLFVVIAKINKGRVEVITVRDMEAKERKLFIMKKILFGVLVLVKKE